MLDKLRTAMGRAEAGAAVPSPQQTALVPVVQPYHQGERMGYLQRNSDGHRPPIACAPYLRTADADIRTAWGPVAAHARTLRQNSGFLSYGVEISAALTVGGDGLVCNITPDHERLGWSAEFAEAWANELEARFAEWCNDPVACDARGLHKFGALQSAALRGWFDTGDVLAALSYRETAGTWWRTSIDVLDPVRLWTPPVHITGNVQVRDGIEFTDSGRPVAYHIRPHAPNGKTVRLLRTGRSGRRIVHHGFDPEAGAIRGISPLGAAVAAITQAQNVHDAGVLAAHVAAMLVGVVTSDLPSDAVVRALGGDGDPLSQMMAHRAAWHEGLKENKAHLTLGHGAKIAHLSTGEKFDLFAGKTGFDQYEVLMKLGLAEAARAMGLAPEILTGDKSDASYSSVRVALAEADSIIKRRRAILIEPLCEFALNAVAEELIDRGQLPFPVKGFGSPLEAFRAKRGLALKADWRGPPMPSADELKSVKAAIERVRFGLSSIGDEIAKSGGDVGAVFKQRKADEQAMANMGLEPLPWPSQTKGATK